MCTIYKVLYSLYSTYNLYTVDMYSTVCTVKKYYNVFRMDTPFLRSSAFQPIAPSYFHIIELIIIIS